MERRRVIIENIHVGPRHREPDMAKVREIAKSISETCLMNPPAVVFRDDIEMDGELLDNVPVLIYGRHRLLALQELGETSVECIVHDVDDLHAELMEIDENLARAELSPAQEAAHIARRKAIWGEINQPTGGQTLASSLSDGRAAGPQHQRKFAAETASVTGDSKSGINQKLRRVETLGPSINRIVGTSLDKGVEMDALIKLPEPERKELIERAVAGESVSARANTQPTPTHDADLEAAVAILDRYGEADMPFLMPHLKPKIAAAIRELMAV